MLQHMAGPDPLDARTRGLPPVPDYVNAAEPVRRGSGYGLRWPTTVGIVPGYLDEEEEQGGFGGFGRRSETAEERERRVRLARERQVVEREARRRMIATFEELGARVVEVELPRDWELLTGGNFNNVRLPERTEPFLDVLRRDVRLFGVSLAPWINGLLLSGPEYLRGQRAKMLLLQRVLDGLFAQCDVVVQTSPIPFDIIGLPLIAFPIGLEETRGTPLPIPGMFGGLPFGEERLLSLVAGYQAVTDWHRRRPADEPAMAPGNRGPDPEHRLDVLDVLESCQ
jgi:Asp-tRNA(Asn)/Glu-tRNA(Gln) amidotransferase A subunit family amidase